MPSEAQLDLRLALSSAMTTGAQIHEHFKALVDDMLLGFIKELGVSPESFYEIIAQQQSNDRLTGFVVQTILTVDDFRLFKAMMVKRNIDLTNQARLLLLVRQRSCMYATCLVTAPANPRTCCRCWLLSRRCSTRWAAETSSSAGTGT